jgi:hypothetical protein
MLLVKTVLSQERPIEKFDLAQDETLKVKKADSNLNLLNVMGFVPINQDSYIHRRNHSYIQKDSVINASYPGKKICLNLCVGRL